MPVIRRPKKGAIKMPPMEFAAASPTVVVKKSDDDEEDFFDSLF